MIALICVDIMNDLVDPKGKISQGIAEFVDEHRTLQRIARVQDHFREQGHLVIHTKTAFQDNYAEYPKEGTKSPILTQELKKTGALMRNEWGTEIPAEVAPKANEPVIVKHRVGAFDRTRMEIILRTHNIKHVYLVGGCTSRSITAVAFNAHDADFNVTVLSESCFDESNTDHQLGLDICKKVAEVQPFDQVALRLTNG